MSKLIDSEMIQIVIDSFDPHDALIWRLNRKGLGASSPRSSLEDASRVDAREICQNLNAEKNRNCDFWCGCSRGD